MSFEKILGQIKEHKETMKMEILPTDPTSRMKAGMINQAKQQIEQLKQDFRDEALRRSVFILVFGTKTKQTVKILKESFGVMSGSPRELASKVVDKIDKGLYDKKQLHPSVIDMSSTILDDIAKDLGVDYLPAFYYDGHVHAVQLNNREDLERVIEKTILAKVGGEIFALNAVMGSLDQLISDEYDQPVIPIVMEVQEEDVAKLKADLRNVSKNVFTMGAGVSADSTADLKLGAKAKLDKNVVQKALEQIKQNLK